MYFNCKQRVWEEIFGEVYSQDFQNIYRRLQGEIFSLNSFTCPQEFIKFMHERNGNYEFKDAILCSLIQELHSNRELKHQVLRLVLAVLWPGMDHLHNQLSPYFPPTENFFADIYWQYLELIFNWNIRKTAKIAVNLKLNVRKRLIHSLKPQSQSEIITFKPDNHKNRKSEYIQEMLDVLTELERAQIITMEDSLLIRGHAIYGKRLVDLAKTHGINYELFRKRYQRLVRKVSGAIGSK